MEIFRLLGKIAIDTAEAEKALDDTTNKAQDTATDTQNAFATIGNAAGTLVRGFALAGAAIGTAWIAAIESTREYRTEMGKLDTAFIVAGHSSETARKTYSDLNAVLGDSGQATEAAQHLAKLTDNEQDLQTWTNICTGVYATFGESLPIESLTEAANETAKSGVLTGALTDALVRAGHNVEEFQAKLDACTTEQQRQKLIMDTLNGTYKDASSQYKETNKDVLAANKAQEKLTNAFSELGRVGEPILTAIKTKVAEFVTAAIPHLENFVNKVKTLRQWIQDNQQTVKNWAAGIIGAGTAIGTFLLILNWGTIMSKAANAIKVVRLAVVAFNTALRANPIGLIVSLIAGLVAAFVYLWNNNEGFRKFWLNMWDKVKSTAATVINAVKNKFGELQTAVNRVKTIFNGISQTISDKMESARKSVKSAIDKIKKFFPLSLGKIFSNIKIPKITVSGGKAPFGIAGKGKLPSFNVKWNAEGGILTKPTIFGMAGNTLLGGGEAGAEAIAPIALLQDYVKSAVTGENEGIIQTLIEQNRAMMDFLASIIPNGVRLDTGVLVGELTPAIDRQLSDRRNHAMRGNSR
jgi:predicted DNA-binding protein YlxM (UPF0122 family)